MEFFLCLRFARVSEAIVMQDSSGKTENVQRRSRESVLHTAYRDFHAHERIDALDEIEKCRKKQADDRQAEITDRRLACLMFQVRL